jgi:hypothetical protein
LAATVAHLGDQVRPLRHRPLRPGLRRRRPLELEVDGAAGDAGQLGEQALDLALHLLGGLGLVGGHAQADGDPALLVGGHRLDEAERHDVPRHPRVADGLERLPDARFEVVGHRRGW